MSENWLILETSGRVARVGLACEGAVVCTAELDTPRRQARELTILIEEMLNAESLRPTHLTGVIASRGPGSYTGLRVGLMTAKALAYALDCKLIAVDTFAAIAEQAPAEVQRVCVIADALQGQVYAQEYALRHDGWLPANQLRILPVGVLAVSLPVGTWISGPGVSVYDEQIPRDNLRMTEADREPRVESLFAVRHLFTPLTKEEVFALEPLYLRGSSAEEKAKNAAGQ